VKPPRRDFFVAAGCLAGGIGLAAVAGSARATPAALSAAIRKVTGGATVSPGKVALVLPPLVENGNSVALSVAVESPMTAADYVRAIHVLAEMNPLPNVISIRFGPRSGRASIATRVRLADTQKIVAIAELSDGTFWSDSKDVVVTLAACTEEVR
jgi:sulfur-oxidizing protein SoxY